MPRFGAAASLAVSASCGSLISASARWQPRRASEIAIARPIPLAAPVTTAVRSRRIIRLGMKFARVSNGVRWFLQTAELQRAVVDFAESEIEQVQRVVLAEPPGLSGSLFGHDVARTLDVAGSEIERRLLDDAGITSARRADIVALLIHVIQQAADILRDEIGFQRPGGVDIAEGGGEVRDVTVHQTFVAQGSRDVRRNTIDAHLHPAQEL